MKMLKQSAKKSAMTNVLSNSIVSVIRTYRSLGYTPSASHVSKFVMYRSGNIRFICTMLLGYETTFTLIRETLKHGDAIQCFMECSKFRFHNAITKKNLRLVDKTFKSFIKQYMEVENGLNKD